MDNGLLEQLPYYLTPVATVLAVFLAYVFGRRQMEHERLYTRRAEVTAKLFERFKDVDQRVYELLHPVASRASRTSALRLYAPRKPLTNSKPIISTTRSGSLVGLAGKCRPS